MTYKFDSLVSKNEAEALKDMIFKRIRERSESMTEDLQQDIMDVARESFVSPNNPFSKIIENTQPQQNISNINTNSVATKEEKQEEIGFPIREIKSKVSTQNKLINEQLTQATIENNMLTAREELSNKKSFMGALNFLNSQAAISLIRTRADKFEVLA